MVPPHHSDTGAKGQPPGEPGAAARTISGWSMVNLLVKAPEAENPIMKTLVSNLKPLAVSLSCASRIMAMSWRSTRLMLPPGKTTSVTRLSRSRAWV